MVIRTFISTPVRWVGTVVGLWILLHVISVTGYPTGAPLDACRDMMPRHGFLPQDNIDLLGITMTTTVRTDNDDDDDEDITVLVELMGVRPSFFGFFRGFMIQARHIGGDTPVGSFENLPDGQQGLDCNGVENSAVTHTNENFKLGVSFSWRPSKKDDATNLVFIATIVKAHDLYWTNITSDVLFPSVSTTPSGKEDPDENNTSTDPVPTTDATVSTVVMESTESGIENSTTNSTNVFQNDTTVSPRTDESNMTTVRTPNTSETSSNLNNYTTTDSPSNTIKDYTTEYVNTTTDYSTEYVTDSQNFTTVTYNTTMYSNVTNNVTTTLSPTGAIVNTTSEGVPNATTDEVASTTESTLNTSAFTTSKVTSNSSVMNFTTGEATTTLNPENVTTSSNFSTVNATIPADNTTSPPAPTVTTDTVLTAPTTPQTTQMTTETINVTDNNILTTTNETQTNATFATTITPAINETLVGNMTTTSSPLNTTTVSIVTNDSSVTTTEMTTILNVTSTLTDSNTTLNGTSSMTTANTTELVTNRSLTTLPTVTNDSFVTTDGNQSMTSSPNVTSVVTPAETTMLVTNASLTTLSTTIGNQSVTTINVTSTVTESSSTPNGTALVTTADTTMLVSNASLTTLSTTVGNQSITTINITSMVTESSTTLNGTTVAEINSTTSLTTTEPISTPGTTNSTTSESSMVPSTSEPTNDTTMVPAENVTTSGIVMSTVSSTESAGVTTSGATSATARQTTVGTTNSLTTPSVTTIATTSATTSVTTSATTSATTSPEQSTSHSTESSTTRHPPTTTGQTTEKLALTEPRIATTMTEQPTVMTTGPNTESSSTVAMTSQGSTTGSRTSVTPATPSQSTVQAPIVENNNEVFLRFRITGVEFTDALTQPSSPQYMSLEADVISVMQQVYSSNSNVRSIAVTRFLEGSVIPEVRLEFTSALDEDSKRDVVGVLYNTVDESGGQLGSFSVDNVASLDENGSFQTVNACVILPCPSGAYCYVDPNDNKCWLTCDRNLGYCLNGGTCVPPGDGETIANCSCASSFEGRRCEVEISTVAPTINLQRRLIIVLAAICGFMALLFFILAVVLICWCRRLRYTKRVIKEDAEQVAKWQGRARRSRSRRDAESSGDETADGQSVVAGTSYIRTEPDAKLPRNLVAIPDDIDTSSGSNFYLTDSDSDSEHFRPKIIEGGVTFPFFGGSGSIPDLLASAADYEMDVMQKMTGNKPLTNSMRGRSVSFSDIQQVISDDDRIGWENFTFGTEAVNPTSTNNNFQMRWDFQVGGNRSGDNGDDDGKDDDERNKGGGGLSGETNA